MVLLGVTAGAVVFGFFVAWTPALGTFPIGITIFGFVYVLVLVIVVLDFFVPFESIYNF
jgi:hypothetical protein